MAVLLVVLVQSAPCSCCVVCVFAPVGDNLYFSCCTLLAGQPQIREKTKPRLLNTVSMAQVHVSPLHANRILCPTDVASRIRRM